MTSGFSLHVVDHPLAATRLTLLRDANTNSAAFRLALRELTVMLVYEATRTLSTELIEVDTPITATKGVRLENPPLLVPVLRAGLGMADATHELMPEASMGFVGLARDEQTHEPTSYMESLPGSLEGRKVIVLDPMLATGGSLLHCLDLLLSRGATDITVLCVLAAPEGLARLEDSKMPVSLYVAAVDERLNEDAFIVPGLGDAGDRQFGAV